MSLPTTMKAVTIQGQEAVVTSNVPLPKLKDTYLLLKPKAVAGNPTDWKHVTYAIGPQGSILGCDVVGEIVKMGPKVDTSKFQIGEYVYGFVHGGSVLNPDNGAFAEYVALDSYLAFKTNKDIKYSDKDVVPEGGVTTFEGAATIPCSWTTAFASLFYHLKLERKWEPASPQKEYPILVWGGATALGQPLIQLMKKINATSKIIAVASKKHESQLKSYGAHEVFDYHDSDVIEQITKKYNNIQYLFDCVSTPETLNQVYQCADSKSGATVLNYMGYQIDLIKPEYKKDNVAVDSTIIYLSLGFEVPFMGATLPQDLAYREAVHEGIEFINPKLNNGELHHIPAKVYKNGLDSVVQIIDDIKNNRNSGEKLVAVFK